MIGKHISHYKILEKLGSGGMGDVYKAQDTKLKRTVALKFLAPNLTRDEEAKTRFIHEAQAASALDQNNICTIHEIDETDDGQMFIAMAHYPGETLTQRIARGPLPLNEAIDIAIHVAEGLSHAHEQGIVHRDIKPANIMVTERGEVKVVDFGLAKLAGGTQLTKESTILGTMAYMSPEQAQGHEVDSRTDIWSLGVILYEMLTGRQPFQAEHMAAAVYSIIHEDPEPVTGLRTDIPAELEWIVNRALAKNPDDRYQTAADLQEDLQKTLTGFGFLSGFKAPQPVSASRKKTKALWVGAACVGLLAAVLLFALLPSSKPDFQSATARPLLSSRGEEIDPSLSPDGRNIAFSWKKENSDNFDIYVRLVAGGDLIQITRHPGGDHQPVWSPDGHDIAFIRVAEQNTGIYLVSALGGDERRIHELKSFIAGNWARETLDWSADGRYLAFSDADSPVGPFTLFLLDVETRDVIPVTSPPQETLGDWVSAFSPDSKTLAFVRAVNWSTSDIFTIPVSGGEPRQLTFDNANAWGIAWSPDSRHIIFNQYSLGMLPASGGTPEPLPATINAKSTWGVTVSRAGSKMAYTESVDQSDIWRLSRSEDRFTKPELFVATSAFDTYPRISPNGQNVVYCSGRSGGGIWMCDADGENHVRLTSRGSSPRWSPDSQNIVYDDAERQYTDIFIVNVEERIPRPFTRGDYQEVLPSYSQDGEWIYFGSNRNGPFNIWKKRIVGDKC